jgi:hypothetical protein
VFRITARVGHRAVRGRSRHALAVGAGSALLSIPEWRLEIDDSTSALRKREEFVGYLRSCNAVGDYAAAEIIFGEIVGRGLAIVQGLSPGVLVDNAYSQGKTVSVVLPVHLA